jgi:hypothetical protein
MRCRNRLSNREDQSQSSRTRVPKPEYQNPLFSPENAGDGGGRHGSGGVGTSGVDRPASGRELMTAPMPPLLRQTSLQVGDRRMDRLQ